MFHCDRYDEERKELEHSVEDIMCRESINSVGVICLKCVNWSYRRHQQTRPMRFDRCTQQIHY